MSIASVAPSGNVLDQFGPWSTESILIYLTVDGSVSRMRVLESDSIASVKLRIQMDKGIYVRMQKLIFDGKELARNNSCVGDYGVGDGNVLHLVLRLSDLQTITVRTVCGKEFELHVERKRNVMHVKEQIVDKGIVSLGLKDQQLIFDGEELEDQRLISSICRDNDTVIHFLLRKSAKVRSKVVEKDVEVSIVASDLAEEIKALGGGKAQLGTQLKKPQAVVKNILQNNLILEPIVVNSDIKLTPAIKQLISGTLDGLERGKQPVRSSEGSGGAYFMWDSSGHKYISVFKPMDEEPMAVNNPRGLSLSANGEGLKRGTRVGEGAFREVAAYILDHPRSGPRRCYNEEEGFAGVPPTVMVKCCHGGFSYAAGSENASKKFKIGSLQMFKKNCGSCEDMGPRAFPVEDVHKISVLDIRLANADRHAGNILISKDGCNNRLALIPIDHGYCLPENFEDCTFEWLYWPQAREPYSPDTVNYIMSLDAEQDIELLKFYGWDLPRECARILRVSTMLLKKGAEKGLSPHAIGSIMCRQTLKQESVVEQIIREAEEAAIPGTSEAAYLESVSSLMDSHLNGLLP
ncbi:phosphatidylinositol 4-kinase gamma 4-like [Apium graveolens]|uniref:phosphatidylinositol 4-kinase gamma 4-like n=1 Tax=Apium graveolens TaxID=4045 RepID=UPI003D7BCEE0